MGSEPYIPLPPQSDHPSNEYWETTPMRCSVEGCRNILATVNPASIKDRMEGTCPTHGRVYAHYPVPKSGD